MVKVTVQPAGHVLDLEDGETILAAARRHGLAWPSLCEGKAECTTCHVKILDGRDGLAAAGAAEREALLAKKRVEPGETRLACQLRPDEDLTVHKRVRFR